MNHSAIDGDIADFLNSQPDLTGSFSTDELRSYLLNQGHSIATAVGSIIEWQQERFWQLDETWQTFSLTAAGLAAVKELRQPQI